MTDNRVPFPIVVGADFDAIGGYALDHARSLAIGTAGAVLHVCRALDLHWGIEGTADRLGRELAALEELVRSRLRGVTLPEVRLHAAFGKPADVLVQLATDVEASLLVIGSHRRRGVQRVMEGSIAHQLVTHAPCPVLIALVPDFVDRRRTAQAVSRPDDPIPVVTGGTLYRLSRALPHLAVTQDVGSP